MKGESRDSPFLCVDATSSEKSGSEGWQYGKYAVKVYTIDGVLIYQAELGGDNTGKSPLGGVILQGSSASSMMATITNPITYYGWGEVINQAGHSGDLYNYYWTSYSRGTDGTYDNTKWHTVYLDGYIPLRVKSIYDPCPYLYRIPSNGTWSQFTSNAGWTQFSYLGGVNWKITTLGESWIPGLGRRSGGSGEFYYTGYIGFYYSSTVSDRASVYALGIYATNAIYINRINDVRSFGQSVRCIDFATLALLLRTSA